MSRVVGYTFEADYHCIACTTTRFPEPDEAIDREGNAVHPVFDTDEAQPLGEYCGDCGNEIVEPFWRIYDGSQDWPDWQGVDECLCGRPLTEDAVPDHCPDCGREPWELLAQGCEGCGKPVDMGSAYYLSDWGDVRHLDCQPVL